MCFLCQGKGDHLGSDYRTSMFCFTILINSAQCDWLTIFGAKNLPNYIAFFATQYLPSVCHDITTVKKQNKIVPSVSRVLRIVALLCLRLCT